jgi:hypothetical protein
MILLSLAQLKLLVSINGPLNQSTIYTPTLKMATKSEMLMNLYQILRCYISEDTDF